VNTRHPHILNASSNLLGICFVIIGGLKLTGSNPLSWADEIAWVASLLFLASIVLAYLGVRNTEEREWHAAWAERAFLAGIAGLMVSVFVMAMFIADPPGPTPSPAATPASPKPAQSALPQPRP